MVPTLSCLKLSFFGKKGSDHRHVLVKKVASQESYRGFFRFGKRFLYKPQVKEAVSHAWNSGSHQTVALVAERLRRVRRALSQWKKENNTNSLDRIQQLEKELE